MRLSSEVGCIKISYTLYIKDLYNPPKINYYGELKVFAFIFWDGLHKNEVCIVNKRFMYSSFKEKCIKINYHWEFKIFALLLWGELYKNQLCIVNKRFMHPFSQEKCIKINYHRKLKIFAPLLWGRLHKNLLCIVHKRFIYPFLEKKCIKIDYLRRNAYKSNSQLYSNFMLWWRLYSTDNSFIDDPTLYQIFLSTLALQLWLQKTIHAQHMENDENWHIDLQGI